jgi:hypothetical protein
MGEVPDRWNEVALPLLRAIGEAEAEPRGRGVFELATFAEKHDLPARLVEAEAKRLLHEGYVLAKLENTFSGVGFLINPTLGPEGQRAIGGWPADRVGQALLDLIDDRLAATSGDERTKWKTLRDGVVAIGTQAAGALAAEALKRA